MVGIVHLSICLRYTMVGIHLSLYASQYTPWVHLHTAVRQLVLVLRQRCSGCTGREPWAQKGENPWVRLSGKVKVDKCVKIGREVCAELLRSPSEERITIG